MRCRESNKNLYILFAILYSSCVSFRLGYNKKNSTDRVVIRFARGVETACSEAYTLSFFRKSIDLGWFPAHDYENIFHGVYVRSIQSLIQRYLCHYSKFHLIQQKSVFFISNIWESSILDSLLDVILFRKIDFNCNCNVIQQDDTRGQCKFMSTHLTHNPKTL